MPPIRRRRRRCWLGPRVGHELAVADRVMINSELEHPVEDETSASRPPQVKTEGILVEIALEIRFAETSLVGPEIPALGQRRHAMNAGQQRANILTGSRGALAVRLVDLAERVDPLVAAPAVGHHRRSWFDVGGDEGVERVGRSVGEDGHAAAAKALWPSALDCDADQDLLSFLATATQSWLLGTKASLVHLDRARQAVPAGSHERRAQPVQQRPRRRVRADLEQPLQAESGDAVRLCSELPPGGEPDCERRAPAVIKRSRRDRRSRTADGALVAAIGYGPSAGIFASRTDEPFGHLSQSR